MDGETGGRTGGRTENRTPISHLAKAGATKTNCWVNIIYVYFGDNFVTCTMQFITALATKKINLLQCLLVRIDGYQEYNMYLKFHCEYYSKKVLC